MGNRYSHQTEPVTNLALLVMACPIPQYKIASDCGMSPSKLSEYINGRRRISKHHVGPLAEYFQVPIDRVLGVPELDGEGYRMGEVV